MVDSAEHCALVAADPGGVLLVGDSLTVESAGTTRARLAGLRRPVCVDAARGRDTSGGADVLARHLAAGPLPSTVVVALGSNDADAPEDFRVSLSRVMGLAPVGHRVLWLDLHHGGRPGGAARVNAAIERATTVFPQLRRVGWDAAVSADPERWLRDGLHTSPDGTGLRAGVLGRALGALRPGGSHRSPV